MLNKYCNFREITLVLCAVFVACGVLGKNNGMTDYVVSPHNDHIFSVCEEYPDNPITKILDISNLSLIYQENNELLMKGTVKIVMEFAPGDKLPIHGLTFAKTRGQWVHSLYSFHNNDICPSLCDPMEVWYPWTKRIEMCSKDFKIMCPPKLGTAAEYNDVIDAKFSFPNRNMDGDYKVTVTVGNDSDLDKFVCFNLFIRVEKL